MNEVLNIECNQPNKNILPNNVEKFGLASNGGSELIRKCSTNKSSPLLGRRSPYVREGTFTNADSSGARLQRSSVTCKKNMNGPALPKRVANFSESCSPPPLKKNRCVKENCLPNLQNFNSIGITRSDEYSSDRKLEGSTNFASHDVGVNKILDSSHVLRSRAMGNISNGLRYTQNTTSEVSSPILTNVGTENISGAGTPLLRGASTCAQTRAPATNSYPPNRCGGRRSSENSLQNTLFPSVRKPVLESRYTENLSTSVTRKVGRGALNDSLFGQSSASCVKTPNVCYQSKAVDKSRSAVLLNPDTPKQRGFVRESPDSCNFGTTTSQTRSVTPRRFPGPAGILPRRLVNLILSFLSTRRICFK